MYKVIKIENDVAFVGKQGGEFTQIPLSNFGFDPQVGDMIEFYQNGDEFIVSKVNSISQFANGGMGAGVGTKSRVTAGVLYLLLGALGVYHFYVGKAGMGILRLLITFIGFIPIFLPIVLIVNVIWNLVGGISVLTSKPGSSWHLDGQGKELID